MNLVKLIIGQVGKLKQIHAKIVVIKKIIQRRIKTGNLFIEINQSIQKKK